jgi:hypothetical protein
MQDIEYDITNLEHHEEEIIDSFVDLLLDERYEEVYLPDSFEGDDVYFQAVIHGRVICEIGHIDDNLYTTIAGYNLQYYKEEKELNIIREFKSLCEEYNDG